MPFKASTYNSDLRAKIEELEAEQHATGYDPVLRRAQEYYLKKLCYNLVNNHRS